MMNTNRAFWRSIHFLGRPYSLAALLVLLINDGILRHAWPSVITGKLSDLAWLFVAPVVVVLGLSLVAPARLRYRDVWLAGFGFAATALAFALLKTVPSYRDGLLSLWQAGLGFPAAVLIDPSDLIALVSVGAAAWLWRRQDPTGESVPVRAIWVVPLLALLTLADAAAPDFGIACLELRGNEVVAYSTYYSFTSSDGGLTWGEAETSARFCDMLSNDSQVVQAGPNGPYIRYEAGKAIESSPDGTNWQVAYSLVPLSQAESAYYQKDYGGNPSVKPIPLNMIVDPASGDVIFAMGFEGVLVRQADGAWAWKALGNYHRLQTSGLAFLGSLLDGEMILAGALALLVIALGAFTRRRHLLWTLLNAAGWLGWVGLLLVFPPALSTQYMATVSTLGALVVAALGLILAGVGVFLVLRHRPATFWRLLVVGVVGGALFFLPYALWAYNFIPQYWLANGIGIVLGIILAITGFWMARAGREVPS